MTVELRRGAGLAIAVMAAAASLTAATLAIRDAGRFPNDFLYDYVSVRELAQGGEVYDLQRELIGKHVPEARDFPISPAQRNAHTPFHLVVLSAFGFLPYWIARGLWLALMGTAFIVAIGLAARHAGFSKSSSVSLGVASLALPMISGDLPHGTTSGILLLLLVGAWLAYAGGHDRRLGLLLAAATALRVYPWLLVIPLLRGRRLRAVLWWGGGVALFSLVPALVIGLDQTLRFFGGVSSENFSLWSQTPWNVSLSALPFRAVAPVDPLTDLAVVTPLGVVVVTVAIGLLAFAAWRSPARATGSHFLAAFPWMIVASPLAWDWYALALLPVVFVMFKRGQLDLGALLLFGIVFFQVRSVAAWIAERGLLVGDPVVARIDFVVIMCAFIGVLYLEYRRSRPSTA